MKTLNRNKPNQITELTAVQSFAQNPLRKTFNLSSAFPFELTYMDTKSLQNELPDHVHDWYELVYVISGKGTFLIDQSLYDMSPGDLFVIPGNTIHRATPDTVNPVTSTAIFFNPIILPLTSFGDSFTFLRCFDEAARHKKYKLHISSADRPLIAELIDHMQQELQSHQPGYRHAIVLELQQLLLHLARQLLTPEQTARSEQSPSWMNESLLYIDQHLNEKLSLTQLASRAAVSAPHYCRVFKQWTGMNVTEYVTTKKVLQAKALLLDHDANVSQVAARCGFDSLTHFHRMFKRMTGHTPAAYRKLAVRTISRTIVSTTARTPAEVNDGRHHHQE